MDNIFEYMDRNLVTASVLSLLMLLMINASFFKPKEKIKINIFLKIIIVVILLIPILEGYNLSNDAKSNIHYFQTAKTLTCKNLSGKYQISQINGWKVHRNYFIKDSLMIRADKCEIED